VLAGGMKRTFLFFKAPTMSRNSASLRRLFPGIVGGVREIAA